MDFKKHKSAKKEKLGHACRATRFVSPQVVRVSPQNAKIRILTGK